MGREQVVRPIQKEADRLKPRMPGETPDIDDADSAEGDAVENQVDEEAAARAKEAEMAAA